MTSLTPRQVEALEKLASLADNNSHNGILEAEKEMRKPRFDGTINLGHILTIIMMGGALATVWVNQRVVQSDHESRLKALENSGIEMKQTLSKLAETQSQGMRNQDKIGIALEYLTRHDKRYQQKDEEQ